MVLPQAILTLMWEYDREALKALEEVPDVVIERVMSRGRLDDMRWLLNSVPISRLRAFVDRRGRRVLAPRELRFWCDRVGIDEAIASTWVQEARERRQAWQG